MKYLPLIIRNVTRNKIRTIFTSLSIAISLFLVVVLHSFLSHQDELTEKSKVHNRVAVLNEAGLAGQLPVAYVDRIRSTPGVEVATLMSWFGGTYREEVTTFPQFATDADTIFQVYEEYKLPPEQLKAWQDDKTGCVVGSAIARSKNWKLGDKIVLGKALYPIDLELTVRGIYDGASTVDKSWVLFHFTYMDEALRAMRTRAGNAGLVMLRTATAQQIPDVMQTIEREFTNSEWPVRTMTEKQFAASFLEMMGNVRGFIGYTSTAVVVALLCVAANTMAMSLRERTREIALLKAIGFPRPSVLGMFLAESAIIGLIGGVFGALGAKALFASIDLSQAVPEMGLFYIPWKTALAGVALAAVVGLFSGIIPAWRAANVGVADGLRRVV